MCRSIKQLRQPQGMPGSDEIRAAALQYVRKVSGYRQPSRANWEVFEQAVEQIARATEIMLESLVQSSVG